MLCRPAQPVACGGFRCADRPAPRRPVPAGIDVFPEEPLPDDHPIRQAKHAVLSSHRAGAIGEGLLNIGRIVADDIERYAVAWIPQAMQLAQPSSSGCAADEEGDSHDH